MRNIILTGTLTCASAAEAAVVTLLLGEHIRLTRAEPGCLEFQVDQTADPLVWAIRERFIDRAAFDAHQARTNSSEWASATARIKRDYRLVEE